MTTLSSEQHAEAISLLQSIEQGKIFIKATKKEFPSFERSELSLGGILGQGSFCTVSEIKAIELRDVIDNVGKNGHSDSFFENKNMEDDSSDDGDGDDAIGNKLDKLSDQEARRFMAMNCIREGDARYAIKALRSDLSESQREKGLIDLAVEAKYLTVISHPNVVKMRGEGAKDSLHGDFFIVLDRLYGTLDDKLPEWRKERSMNAGCLGCIGGDKLALQALLSMQLTYAYDLSAAYLYLHKRDIIYRDIKSENIGFDVRGDIKIFDFGLCRQLDPKKRTAGGLYKLTGLTGSRRYMAPEVALCKPYNLTADSFSFGILLWEIFAMQTPFENFDVRDHTEKVVKMGYRPSVPSYLPISVKEIIKDCWAAEILKRPDFKRISTILRNAANDMTNSSEVRDRTQHMMNRSNTSRHCRY